MKHGRNTLTKIVKKLILSSFTLAIVTPFISAATVEIPLIGTTYQDMCFKSEQPEILPFDQYFFSFMGETYTGIMVLKAPDKDLTITIINTHHTGTDEYYGRIQDIIYDKNIALLEGVNLVNITPNYLNHPLSDIVNYMVGEERQKIAESTESLMQPEFTGDSSTVIYVVDGDLSTLIDFDDNFISRTYWKLYSYSPPIMRFVSFFFHLNNSPDYFSYIAVCSRNPIVEKEINRIYQSMGPEDHISIAVPWGEAHGPDFVRRLYELNFRIETTGILQAIPPNP